LKRLASLALLLSLLATLVLPALQPTYSAFAQEDGTDLTEQEVEEPPVPTDVPPTEIPIPTDIPPSETPIPPPPTATNTEVVAPVEPSATEEPVGPAATDAATSTPFKNLNIGDRFQTTARVNCRITPSTSAGVVKVTSNGEQGVVLEPAQRIGSFDWIKVQLLDPQTTQCYLAAQYVELVEAGYGIPPTVTPTVQPTQTRTPVATPYKNLKPGDRVVATSSVNCRVGPSTGSAVVTLVATGSYAYIVEGPQRSGGYDWAKVQLPNAMTTQCYLAAQYVSLSQSGVGIPPTITPTASRTPVATSTPTRTSTATLTPSNTATATETLTPSNTPTATLTPTETLTPTITNTPTETLTPTITNTPTETFTPTVTNTPTNTLEATLTPTPTYRNIHAGDLVGASQSVNCRSTNSASASISRVLEKNERAIVLTDPANANGYWWSKIRPLGTTIECFVVAQYLDVIQAGGGITPTAAGTVTPTGPFKTGDIIETTASVNMRTDAGTNNPIIATLSSKTTGTVMAGYKKVGSEDWIQVQFANGNGWVAARYVRLVSGSSPGGPFAAGERVVANTSVNLRLAPTTSSTALALLSTGTQGIALGMQAKFGTVTWVQVEFPAGVGWVDSQYLKKLTAVTPTTAPSVANVWVYLDCTSNPERILVTNNNPQSIRVISIGSTYMPTAAEPFSVGHTLGSKVTLSYTAGSGSGGTHKLTSSLILSDDVGSAEGVVVKTSLGDVTATCPTVTTGEKWIEVNLSTQTMTVWRGSTKVSSSLVSSGKPGFTTPAGTFYISTKYPSVTMSGCVNGECWNTPGVPWAMLFRSGGFYIHGAYWHNDFGRVRSHGCVNLPVPYAEWLYSWTPSGTRVWIHY
jgi:uncharacterized protein YraI